MDEFSFGILTGLRATARKQRWAKQKVYRNKGAAFVTGEAVQCG
jgi:hypothetical protein